jgi:hypothetical protein
MSVHPIDVEQYLHSMSFPAAKSEIVSDAHDRNAPQEIVSALSNIPERIYNSAADAARETYRPELDSRDQIGLDSCDD